MHERAASGLRPAVLPRIMKLVSRRMWFRPADRPGRQDPQVQRGQREEAAGRARSPAGLPISAAGAAQVPYRTFLFFNVVGGIAWGVGYCLLGYLAGSAYVVVEKRVGTGLAVAVAAAVLALAGTWAVRRHRAAGG
jgi:hypothetical protein